MEGYVYAEVIVEGATDVPVITALMRAAGWADSEFRVTSANGKGVIDRDLKNYWEAARVLPYVVFRDLDRDGGGCPVTLRAELVEHTPGESPDLLIRIVPVHRVVDPGGPAGSRRVLREGTSDCEPTRVPPQGVLTSHDEGCEAKETQGRCRRKGARAGFWSQVQHLLAKSHDAPLEHRACHRRKR